MSVEEGGRRSVRRWYALLILGLILHGLAMVNSDLGLDAHVRLNAAADDRAPGQDLAWDKLRIEDERVQEPSSNHSYEGYIPPWYSSAWSVKLTSFVGVLCTAVLAGLVPRWRDEGFHFDPMWSSLVLLSPVFLFVSGRGYDEGILACIVGLGVSGFFFHRAEGLGQCFLSIVLLATSTLLLLGWKGFGMMVSLGIWAGVVVIGSAWMWLDQRGSETTRGYTRHPWKMAATVSTLLYVAVFLFGLFSRTGTLSIVGQHPLKFAAASVVALTHVVLVFLLIGFFLWPFVPTRWKAIGEMRGRGPTLLAVYSCALLTGIVAYIAALWTLESSLWNRPLLATMVVLGNNGRYATALLIPFLLFIKWCPPNTVGLKTEWSRFRVAFATLTPLILFVSLFGQQLWSEDAGEWLADSWEEEDSCLVMVAPDTLAMHHLYVLKTHVDLTGAESVEGYWRTSEQVQTFFDDHPDCNVVLVVAPGEEFTPSLSYWERVEDILAPFTLSGGFPSDGWRVYRPVG